MSTVLIGNALQGHKMTAKTTGKAGAISATRLAGIGADWQRPVSPPPPGVCCCATMSSPLTVLVIMLWGIYPLGGIEI